MKHSWEVERSLLGGLMLDPSQLPEVSALVSSTSWHRPQHARLWELLTSMADARRAIDVVTVRDDSGRRDAFDDYGGAAYVAALPNACPSVANLPGYAERIREHAIRRDLQLALAGAGELVKEGQLDLPELLDRVESGVFAVTRAASTQAWHTSAELVTEQMAVIEARCAHPGAVTGLATGFVDLDRMLAGLQKSDLIVLAARPAMGKTALALQVALTAAKGGVTAAFFSLEMSRQQLTSRALCLEGRVDAGRVRTGRLDADDWRQLVEAAERVAAAELLIDDTPGMSISALRSKARMMMAQRPNLGLIVVDYLQLMQGQGGTKETRENAISTISRGLKILAKELNVPVIALSQLNRSLEARSDKRPLPSDLRESGAIEQDADVILFIYRDEYYNPESPDKGLAELIVAKQRSGPTGMVKVAFLGQFTMFQNYAGPEAGGEDGYA